MSTELQQAVLKALEHGVDSLACERHNDGGNLTDNTQEGDLRWLAATLFAASRLGAGSVETVPWLIGREQWEQLGLTPVFHFGDGPRRWDMLSADQQDAWLKLASIVMYVIPAFAERVGHRWMLQAKAIREVWNEVRKET